MYWRIRRDTMSSMLGAYALHDMVSVGRSDALERGGIQELSDLEKDDDASVSIALDQARLPSQLAAFYRRMQSCTNEFYAGGITLRSLRSICSDSGDPCIAVRYGSKGRPVAFMYDEERACVVTGASFLSVPEFMFECAREALSQQAAEDLLYRRKCVGGVYVRSPVLHDPSSPIRKNDER